ncbi:MAG: hypothetical protein ACWGQW_17785, partial [bacterium]
VEIMGRHSYFHGSDPENAQLKNPEKEFQLVSGVPCASVALRSSALELAILRRLLNYKWFKTQGKSILSLHRFGFIETDSAVQFERFPQHLRAVLDS